MTKEEKQTVVRFLKIYGKAERIAEHAEDRIHRIGTSRTYTKKEKTAKIDAQMAIIDRAEAVKDMIDHMIRIMADAEYMDLLYRRYVQHKDLGTISDEVCLSYDWTRHKAADALREFGVIYGKNIEKQLEKAEALLAA